MKNTLSDLNNHLFAALERVNEEGLDSESLESAIRQGEAVTKIAETVIHNAALQLKALEYADEYGRIDDSDAKIVKRQLLGGGVVNAQVAKGSG